MRKRNSNNSNYEHCSICFPTDDEVIAIVDSLLQKILDNLALLNLDSAEAPCSKLEPLDFNKLVKMIFGRRFKNLKATNNCKHHELKKNFIQRVGCNQKDIDRISGVLSWRIAKFQFHTDVIVAQSKSFLRHFVNGEGSKDSSQRSSQRKKQSSLSIHEVKQQQEQKQRQGEVRPAVVAQGPINLQSIGLIHKSQDTIYDPFPMMWHFAWPTHMLIPAPDPNEKGNGENEEENEGGHKNEWGNFEGKGL